MKVKRSTTKINKSAITGKFVSEKFAKTHFKTTFRQTIKRGK